MDSQRESVIIHAMTRPPITEFIAFLPAPNWEATRQFYEQTLG